MINFEQVNETSRETYPVRREYYAYTSPAAKGAKWQLHSKAGFASRTCRYRELCFGGPVAMDN